MKKLDASKVSLDSIKAGRVETIPLLILVGAETVENDGRGGQPVAKRYEQKVKRLKRCITMYLP